MMMKFTKTATFCLLLISFFCFKAQENTILKSFINKNDIAVRSVQKYSININDPANEAFIKELLKLQVASVKLFKSDPSKSADIAYQIRTKCSDFLSKNSKGSLEYLTLSDKEQSYFSSPKPVDKIQSFLNKKEMEKINSVDVKNPHLFDDLNTRIP